VIEQGDNHNLGAPEYLITSWLT